MANLVIDIGNSRTKLGIFNGDTLLENLTSLSFDGTYIDQLYKEHDIQQAIISSVANQTQENELLKKYKFLSLTHKTPLPLAIKYETPETLGLDRIAGSVGAYGLFGSRTILVIDIGTCITYDFIDQTNYLGGSISPGLRMRLTALHTHTKKLPSVTFNQDKPKLIGSTTEESMISGVYHGIKNEITGTIQQYQSQYNDLKVVVTGGDANLFEMESKNRIFVDPFLVLKGLNEILKFNEQ